MPSPQTAPWLEWLKSKQDDPLYEELDAFSVQQGWHARDAEVAGLRKLVGELKKELARYKEEPCPKNHSGHWFDCDGNCTYCGKYDEENNLRLVLARAEREIGEQHGNK